jgi:hypothetical protein
LASSATVWPALAFLAVAILSLAVGQLSWFNFASHAPLGAQLGGLSILVLSVGAFLLGANVVRDLHGLRTVTFVFLAFAAVYTLLRDVLPALKLPTQDWLQGTGGLFPLWLFAVAGSQAAFNRDLQPRWRLALGVLAVYTLADQLLFRYANTIIANPDVYLAFIYRGADIDLSSLICILYCIVDEIYKHLLNLSPSPSI